MMIAAGDQSGPRRTAQGGGVEVVVAQPLARKFVHRGRRNAATKGAVLTKAAVIDQDQQDIRRAFRCPHRLRELRGIGLKICAPDLSPGNRKSGRGSTLSVPPLPFRGFRETSLSLFLAILASK